MKQTLRFLSGGAVALAATAAVNGQNQPVPNQASAGLVNEWLHQQSAAYDPVDLGGQFRVRFEYKEHGEIAGSPGAIDFRQSGADSENSYWLFRERVHLGYSPAPWITLFGEARDSFVANDNRNPSPDSDRFDLGQAYVRLGDPKNFPVSVKVGRQELTYGDDRVLGTSDWNNPGRVFDAAKVRFEKPEFWADAFVGRVVIPRDRHFDLANDYDWLTGVYAGTRTLVPKQETQVYFLARNVGLGSETTIGPGLPAFQTGASPRDIYTIGARVKSLPGQLNGWDYEAETAEQWGRFKTAAAAASLDHEAFAIHAGGGYSWRENPVMPRLGLEYNFASGDDNAADGKHGTFENLFPTNHKFYGYMDFASWQNLHNPRVSVSLKPEPQLTLAADYHLFWLADTHDYFYKVNGLGRKGAAPGSGAGYGLNPGYNSYVGSELDFIATYTIKPHAILQFGYGHFFVGDYVKESLATVGAADADWFYAQFVLNF